MQLRGQGKIVFIYFPFILERILFYFFYIFRINLILSISISRLKIKWDNVINNGKLSRCYTIFLQHSLATIVVYRQIAGH